MQNGIAERVSRFSPEIQSMFLTLRELALKSSSGPVEEKLWAGLPSYYAGEKFIRLIPFQNHINIEASAIALHRPQPAGCKLTPKGMLQVFAGKELPLKELEEFFGETLKA